MASFSFLIGVCMTHGQGIALRLAATALITAMSACVHEAAKQATVGQIMFWRSFIAIFPIVLYLGWRGGVISGLRTKRLKGHFLRSGLGCAAMSLSFLSLAYLPVANATALLYLVPILTLPAAVIFLGEKLTSVVIISVALGFGGIIAMLAPSFSGEEVKAGTLIGVGAGVVMAVVMAFARVQIKQLTQTETPVSIAFYFALTCTVIGALSYPMGWGEPEGLALYALIGAGIFGGLAHIAAMEAVARAPVSVLAPFEYTGMIWALAFDVIFFGGWPAPLSLAGAVTIVAAASLVALKPDLRLFSRFLRRSGS